MSSVESSTVGQWRKNMTDRETCCLCRENEAIGRPTRRDGTRDVFDVRCRVCGSFEVSHSVLDDLDRQGGVPVLTRRVLSTYVRTHWEGTHLPFLIMSDHLADPAEKLAFRFMTVLDRIDSLVRFLAERSPSLGFKVDVHRHDWPLFHALNGDEFGQIVAHLRDTRMIDVHVGWQAAKTIAPAEISLTVEGWKRATVLREQKKPGQAFIAAWFDDELKEARDAIWATLEDDCRYAPKMADRPQSNEKICDHIMALIRQSGLVVVDVSGQRPNVYYEAGFAQGLGIPVIWTCRKSEEDKVHFDTRQYPHIFWKDIPDLKRQLKDKVQGCHPRKK
jgi:hypothetical protein